MDKSSVIIIGILSITILVLSGFIVLSNSGGANEQIDFSNLERGAKSNIVVTEDFCIDLAKDAVKKYEKCIELGSTEVWSSVREGKFGGERIDCVSNNSAAPSFCEHLSYYCRMYFPLPQDVLANCLSYKDYVITDFNHFWYLISTDKS